MLFLPKDLTSPQISQFPLQIPSSLPHLLLLPLGLLLTLSFFLFTLLSLPIYLYRLLLSIVAPYLHPSLHSLVSAHSCFFVHDLFTSRPTCRSNIIISITLQGRLTLESLHHLILQKWILPRHLYPQFQQYPVPFLGFYFWRDDPHFSIKNHLHLTSSCKNLENVIETLLNSKFPPNQSPWEIHLIPNDQESIVIFKVHHTLADGFSILGAMLQGLGLPFDLPTSLKPMKQSPSLHFLLTFPFKALWEFCYYYPYHFKTCPWQIPDKHKAWYQLTSVSPPIPIQTVKRIKDHFGVSFSSVLLFALSRAMSKSLSFSDKFASSPSSMLCCSMLPVPALEYRKNHRLTNLLTGALFEMPLNLHPASPVKLLKEIDGMLESTKQSVIPVLLGWYGMLLGSHLAVISRLLMKNWIISTGLSNFAGFPTSATLNGHKILDVNFRAGLTTVVGGAGIMVLSHNQSLRIALVAEKGLMDRSKAELFLRRVIQEIERFEEMCNKN